MFTNENELFGNEVIAVEKLHLDCSKSTIQFDYWIFLVINGN